MKNIFEPKNNLFVPWGCFVILIIFSAIAGYYINAIVEYVYHIRFDVTFDICSVIVCTIVLILDIKVLEKWDIHIQESYKRKVNFHASFVRKYNESQKALKDTAKHIDNVIRYMRSIINHLADRANEHDESLLIEPEASEFSKIGGVNSLFNTKHVPQYILDHHYRNNTHHIEHYNEGIVGMDLLDIIEMLCDWKDLSKRHDVDLIDYIKSNQAEYQYSDEMCSVLCNTAMLLYKYAIYYTNDDTGIIKIYYGDTILSLADMITDDKSLTDREKYNIRYGVNGEFLNNEYRNTTIYGKRSEYKYVVNEFRLWA